MQNKMTLVTILVLVAFSNCLSGQTIPPLKIGAKTTSLTNPSKSQTLKLESFRFEITEFQPTKSVDLVYQVFPFLGNIVVRTSNIGEGKVVPSEFRPFSDKDLARRLGTENEQFFLHPFSTKELNLLVCLQVDFDKYRIPDLPSGLLGLSYRQPLSSPRYVLRPQAIVVDGKTVMPELSDFQYLDSTGKTRNYLGLNLGFPEVSEGLLAKEYGVQTGIGLFHGWMINEGLGRASYDAQTLSVTQEMVSGVSVTLSSKSSSSEITKRLGFEMAPGQKITFPIHFLVDESATFKVASYASYRIGQGNLIEVKLHERERQTVTIPKVERLDSDAKSLIANLLAAHPSLIDKAKQVVASPAQYPQSDFRDAVKVALSIEDSVLRSVIQKNIAEIVVAKPSRESIWLLAHLDPQSFAKSFVEKYTKRNPDHEPYKMDKELRFFWLSACVSSPSVRAILRSEFANPLSKKISTVDPKNWMPQELILAVLVGDRRGIDELISTLSRVNPTTTAWVAQETKDPKLFNALKNFMGSGVDNMRAKAMINAFKEAKISEMSDSVSNFVLRKKDDAGYGDSMLASLDYLQHFTSPQVANAIRSLKNYRYQSKIREKAASILGE